MARVSLSSGSSLDVALGLGKDEKEISKSSQKLLKARLEAEKKMKLLYDKQYQDLSYKQQQEYNKKLRKLQDSYLKESLKDKAKEVEEKARLEYETTNNVLKKTSAALKLTTASFASQLGNATSRAISSGLTEINNYINSYGQYMSAIQTRLQGSTKDYYSMVSMFNRNLAASPYVSQEKLLNNLSTLVAQGISYNVEQRAFLMTVSDKIATTFDAANGTLLRLIKIQQSDSTAARLGLETSLNQFLNKMFQDTSYLNNLSKSVSSAIIDANSQLSREQSLAFEYQTQKWLGALSSVGVSESAISTLAQGIGYLGSGNISALSSNQSLQNLLIMAANMGGLDYSRMLTQGMSASDVNALMQGVVKYGQQIGATNNQVVKSAYAQMFGMTISDLTSIMNLSSKDLVEISNNMLNYSQAISAAEQGLASIGERTTLAEKIQNIFGNVMSSIGGAIASNAITYSSWLLADMLQKSGADPTIKVGLFGSGIETTAATAAKSVIVGAGLLTRVGDIVGALQAGGGLRLTGWGEAESTGRNWQTNLEQKQTEVITGEDTTIKDILQDSIDSNVQLMTQTTTSINNTVSEIKDFIFRQG